MGSEAAERADFSAIRYAQCWEDADILLAALDIQPGETVVSIASAGDNSLSLLTRGPGRVIALDLSQAQLFCLEIRVAAYRTLDHHELLELIGSRPSTRRPALYARLRPALGSEARRFWDAMPREIERGIGSAGKFEHYFSLFRRRIMPLVHSRRTIDRLLAGGTRDERIAFWDTKWDTWRWRALFRLFFSRMVMGRLGRDPEFFRYVDVPVSERLLARGRYAGTELNPADNPYAQWIFTGAHTSALPHALRPEHYDAIRDNLDRLEWRLQPMEDFLAEAGPNSIDAYNLSDIFEYMSEPGTEQVLWQIAESGRPGARLAYWNMLAPRSRPESLADRIAPLPEISAELFAQDKAYFYSAFVVEEVRA
jgi:S-adenosylmethionine-diacylglycerol 3-amino-3-carboxypropyl transferase